VLRFVTRHSRHFAAYRLVLGVIIRQLWPLVARRR
jgi:hypothetical protein